MRLLEAARHVLELSDVLEKGLRLLGPVLHSAVPGTAADAVMVARVVWNALEGASTGRLTVIEAHAALDKLTADLAANDKAADHALDQKFPKG